MKNALMGAACAKAGIPSKIYLVTSVTHQRRPLFVDFHLSHLVVGAMRHHTEQGNVESLAFVVMPDHFHWLLGLGDAMPLSKVVGLVKSYSARSIRHRLADKSHNEPIWQEGYHDHALREEEDIQGIARYIVANPLRAGLTGKVGDYPLWDAIWL
ncbi:MAG: transposase [Sulfuricella sp.]|nr:transposase [Sulfuricella sp.]